MRVLLLVLVIVLSILVVAGPGYLLGKCYLEKSEQLRGYTEETTAYRTEISRLQKEQQELRRALQQLEHVKQARDLFRGQCEVFYAGAVAPPK
jgi:chromosome segregation ATPase